MEEQPLRADGSFDAVIQHYQTMVFGLALAKTGSRSDADDVFQEVFLALFRSGKTFRDEEHRKAWLLRTTLNLSRRVTASSWRQKTVPLDQAPAGELPAPPLFRDPRESRVWEALERLPEDYRLPLYLFYFQELSTGEIAHALSLGPGAVRMRLSRGRDRLRDLLKGEMFDG